MRPADARFSASTMISSSIRLSLVGAQVDCSTNTSLPRTFSNNSTITSPSENRETCALPRRMFRLMRDRSRQARIRVAGEHHQVIGDHLHRHAPINELAGMCTSRTFRRLTLAGEEGFEPSNAGIKIRCLNQLGDSPKNYSCSVLLHLPPPPDDYQAASGCSFTASTTQPRHPCGNSAVANSACAIDSAAIKTAEPDPVIRAAPKRSSRFSA